jgi:hypothetical protein
VGAQALVQVPVPVADPDTDPDTDPDMVLDMVQESVPVADQDTVQEVARAAAADTGAPAAGTEADRDTAPEDRVGMGDTAGKVDTEDRVGMDNLQRRLPSVGKADWVDSVYMVD